MRRLNIYEVVVMFYAGEGDFDFLGIDYLRRFCQED